MRNDDDVVVADTRWRCGFCGAWIVTDEGFRKHMLIEHGTHLAGFDSREPDV